jgi:N-acetylglucosaminyl-diphospho-decaprenol L-rhamnosyltransferase
MALAVTGTPRAILVTPQRQGPKTPLLPLRLPQLSVVIVNYRLWEETGQLVRQLLAAPCTQRGQVEVVVVDNHSPPHPLARRLRRWPGVSLRRWGRNRGFARAVNEGCRLSQGEWILLLNPDITLPHGFVEEVLILVERLVTEEPKAGIVGFQLRNTDGSSQLSCGPFPTLMQMLLRLTLPRTRRKYYLRRSRRRCLVSWVTGCCLLLRRTCLEQIGGLDRDFFLYYEDVDLCRRAQAHGWTVLYEPRLRVIHHAPLHLRPIPAHLRLLTRHALLTYAVKHWPRWQASLLTRIVQLEAFVRRRWAQRRRDASGERSFQILREIAVSLREGEDNRARELLEHVVRSEERQLAS